MCTIGVARISLVVHEYAKVEDVYFFESDGINIANMS